MTLQIENDSNPAENDSNPAENDSNPAENDSNPAENDSNFDSNYTDLTEKEAKVLEVLRKNNDVSARQMSDNTGISISTVNRIYKILKEKGYIDRKNKTRGAWNILK